MTCGNNCFLGWVTLIKARMVAPRHQNTLTATSVASGNDALWLGGKLASRFLADEVHERNS
jgi:hypothetical protein